MSSEQAHASLTSQFDHVLDDSNESPRFEARKAFFIVFEGIDGAGTTTQADRLANYLQNKGQKVLQTNEPSNGPAGMLIRLALAKRLLGPNYDYHDPRDRMHVEATELDPQTLALLFAADRADHLATQIDPSLRRGRHVICDRYLLSSLAYQGLRSEVDWLLAINKPARVPDLTIYLHVPAERARLRMRHARWAKDLYEDEAHQRLIEKNYVHLINCGFSQVGPVVIVDGTRSRDQVFAEVKNLVDELVAGATIRELRGELSLF
jgi:dTMP kinase